MFLSQVLMPMMPCEEVDKYKVVILTVTAHGPTSGSRNAVQTVARHDKEGDTRARRGKAMLGDSRTQKTIQRKTKQQKNEAKGRGEAPA